MSDKSIKDKISQSQFVKKLKSIKHFDVIVVVLFCCILLLIYFSDFSFTDTGKKSSSQTSDTFISYTSYTKDLETRLATVLSGMKGVSKVKVMITLKSSPELVIAYNTQEKSSDTKDSVTIIKEPVIINQNGKSSPVVLCEVLPQIKGVIIVAEGADNVNVKLNIMTATMKLLGISANSIEIFAGE